MKVTIRLRGTLKKYFGDDFERTVEVPEGCTCDQALQAWQTAKYLMKATLPKRIVDKKITKEL